MGTTLSSVKPMDAAVTEAAQATATMAAHMAPKATASKGKSQAASTDIAAINAAISNPASKRKSQDLHGDNHPNCRHCRHHSCQCCSISCCDTHHKREERAPRYVQSKGGN